MLESESVLPYRPVCTSSAGNAVPGGLLDFRKEEALPLVIVPDLHARADFFCAVLNYPLPAEYLRDNCGSGKTVSALLAEKRIYLLCLGDGFHSEQRGQLRWIEAFGDYCQGIIEGSAMTAEMTEGLDLMRMVMQCKCRYPAQFHFLKGNHENILNAERDGDHSFGKFVCEGQMVYDFMRGRYGVNLLRQYAYFEHLLPLCAVFPQCMASHAEPRRAYSRQELIDAPARGDVVEGLTWTANNEALPGSACSMLRDFLPDADGARYFGGHRPVRERYALRDEGAFIQIHNPDAWRVAVVPADRPFDENRDILDVGYRQ